MSDLDQIADQAAKKMAEGLLTQDKKVRNWIIEHMSIMLYSIKLF